MGIALESFESHKSIRQSVSCGLEGTRLLWIICIEN